MKINKKEKERYAVINFYKNRGISVDSSKIEFIEENSPIDVIYEKEKFQIKCFPAGAEEVEGRLDSGEDNVVSRQNPKNYEGKIFKIEGLDPVPEMSASLNFNEMKDAIIKVINDANNKYSPNAIKNVVLLINDRHIPEDVIERVVNSLDLVKFFKNINFKEIYFVGFKNNLKIYPTFQI
jgi:hypothetical protein